MIGRQKGHVDLSDQEIGLKYNDGPVTYSLYGNTERYLGHVIQGEPHGFVKELMECNVSSLDLRNNKIGKSGLQGIGWALQYNTSIKSIDLRQNTFGIKVIDDFINAIHMNYSLVDVRLDCTPLQRMLLADLAERNQRTILDLTWHTRPYMLRMVCHKACEVVVNNWWPKVKEMHNSALTVMRIYDDDVIRLLHFFMTQETVRVLDVRSTFTGGLDKMLQSNHTLLRVKWGNCDYPSEYLERNKAEFTERHFKITKSLSALVVQYV